MLLDKPVQAGIDIELPIVVRQLNKRGDVLPASDFTTAQFNIYSVNRNIVLTKSLGSGIVVEDVSGDSLFIVTLTSAETMDLEGLYLTDFVVTDIENKTSMPVHDELTFKPRLGA